MVARRLGAGVHQLSRRSQLHRRVPGREQDRHLSGPERRSRQFSRLESRQPPRRFRAAGVLLRDLGRSRARSGDSLVDSSGGCGHRRPAAKCGTPKRVPAARFAGSKRGRQIFWADGNRLVFPWERDGWLHLYSVSADGGRAQLLTPGEFEVEHVSLSRDRREVLFSSNQDVKSSRICVSSAGVIRSFLRSFNAK